MYRIALSSDGVELSLFLRGIMSSSDFVAVFSAKGMLCFISEWHSKQ